MDVKDEETNPEQSGVIIYEEEQDPVSEPEVIDTDPPDPEGTVLSSKESIIIFLQGTETVVSVDRFLSVRQILVSEVCRAMLPATR